MSGKFSVATLFIALVLFAGCETEVEGPPPTTLCTLVVNPYFESSDNESWIIVLDEHGAPLETRTFEAGDSIVIETTKPVSGNMISATFLEYYPDDRPALLYTFTNLELGRMLEYSPDNPYTYEFPGALSGECNVKLSFPNTVENHFLSNKYGEGGASTSTDVDENYECSIRDGANDYLVVMTEKETGHPKYKMLNDVEDGRSYEVSWTDLADFDHTVDFNLSPGFTAVLLVMGSEELVSPSPGYWLQYNFNDSVRTSLKAGYLNTLTRHITNLNVGYPEYSLGYRNQGSIPETIAWPMPSDFTITSKSISNFSSSSSKPFKMCSAGFSFKAGETIIANWHVLSPSGSHVLQPLPPELIARYPELELAKFSFESIYFETERLPYERVLTTIGLDEDYVEVSIYFTEE